MENILKKYQWVEDLRKQLDSFDSEEKKEVFLENILPIYKMGGIYSKAPTEEDNAPTEEDEVVESVKMWLFKMTEENHDYAKRADENAKSSKRLSIILSLVGILATILATIITYFLTKC